jgi:hypothetical protein
MILTYSNENCTMLALNQAYGSMEENRWTNAFTVNWTLTKVASTEKEYNRERLVSLVSTFGKPEYRYVEGWY